MDDTIINDMDGDYDGSIDSDYDGNAGCKVFKCHIVLQKVKTQYMSPWIGIA